MPNEQRERLEDRTGRVASDRNLLCPEETPGRPGNLEIPASTPLQLLLEGGTWRGCRRSGARDRCSVVWWLVPRDQALPQLRLASPGGQGSVEAT